METAEKSMVQGSDGLVIVAPYYVISDLSDAVVRRVFLSISGSGFGRFHFARQLGLLYEREVNVSSLLLVKLERIFLRQGNQAQEGVCSESIICWVNGAC